MLAVRIDPRIHDLTVMTRRSHRSSLNLHGRGAQKRSEGWAYPIAVCATSAHSTDGGGYNVVIDPDRIGAIEQRDGIRDLDGLPLHYARLSSIHHEGRIDAWWNGWTIREEDVTLCCFLFMGA